MERDYPEGHPLAADFDAESATARDYSAAHPAVIYPRDYPIGHPSAADSTAKKTGDGYAAVHAASEDGLRPGELAFRGKDVLVAACPIHGDRHEVDLVAQKYDPRTVTLDGAIALSCGRSATVRDGVWHLA